MTQGRLGGRVAARGIVACAGLLGLVGCQTILGNTVERNTPSVVRPASYSYLDTWTLDEAKRDGYLWIERYKRAIDGTLKRRIHCTVMYNIADGAPSPDTVLKHYGELVKSIADRAGSEAVSVETGREVMGLKPLSRFKAEFDVPGVESWHRGGSLLRQKEVKLPWRFSGTILESGSVWMATYCLASEKDGVLADKFLETVNGSFTVGDVQI